MAHDARFEEIRLEAAYQFILRGFKAHGPFGLGFGLAKALLDVEGSGASIYNDFGERLLEFVLAEQSRVMKEGEEMPDALLKLPKPKTGHPPCGYTTKMGRWCDAPMGHEGDHNSKGPR